MHDRHMFSSRWVILGKFTESVRLIAFVLIVLGTLGLLANEFLVGWGRPPLSRQLP